MRGLVKAVWVGVTGTSKNKTTLKSINYLSRFIQHMIVKWKCLNMVTMARLLRKNENS